MDRAYTNLLAHLRQTSSTLPLTTIQNALAHYLAHLAPPPTPLAASAVSAPLYLTQPFTNDKLQSFLTAFRHATHLKYRKKTEDLKNSSRLENLFSKSLNAALSQWVSDVVKGIQGGHPVLRLASLSGLLLGAHDLELEVSKHADEGQTRVLQLGSSRNVVEEELIVAVAEVIDSYGVTSTSPSSLGDWEKEFQPSDRDVLTLALIISSQSLPLVSQPKFNVLPLSTLNNLLVVTLSSTFHGGRFLHDLPTSCVQHGEHGVSIPSSSSSAKTLHALMISPIMVSAASVSRLVANCLRSLLESYIDSKKTEGLVSASETLRVLREIAVQVEQDWSQGPLADLPEQNIAPDTRPITQGIWTSLKTLLFATIMLSDAILTSVIYIQPDSASHIQASTSSSELSLQVLQILSHFAFLISQFGGVTSTSQGFEHLKKTFYLALDILVQEDGRSNRFQNGGVLASSYVKDQCLSLKSSAITRAPSSVRNAKRALVLASIEQLVPLLNEEDIREYVFDVCWPHLSDPSHRETFELAHSVILAVFASHAQARQSQPNAAQSIDKKHNNGRSGRQFGKTTDKNRKGSGFVKKMIPFYAQCLIENSFDGRLNTSQLRMAYAALVQCAGASGPDIDNTPEAQSLAWYCVQLLLDAIHFSKQGDTKEKRKEGDFSADMVMAKDRLHRLHLTLISAVPSLPLALMLRVLQEIKMIINSLPLSSAKPTSTTSSSSTLPSTDAVNPAKEQTARSELLKALYEEIVGRVGHREKSILMRWWYDNRLDMLGTGGIVPTSEEENKGIRGGMVPTL